MSASYLWTLAFAVALLAGLGVKFWLATRQIRHVARHRGEVPADFAGTVPFLAICLGHQVLALELGFDVASPIDAVFATYVNLCVSELEPETASGEQRGGLRYFT